MHYRRPTYVGYQAALISSFLMGVALLVVLAHSGLDGRKLIPLYSSWSALEPDGSAPGIAGEQVPPMPNQDNELLEMLRGMEGPDGETVTVVEDPAQWRVVRMRVTAYCPCRKCSDRPVDVKDRGRLIKGNRLDVFFASHRTAKKWGTKTLDVMVRVD
jgi:hypothetical protein